MEWSSFCSNLTTFWYLDCQCAQFSSGIPFLLLNQPIYCNHSSYVFLLKSFDVHRFHIFFDQLSCVFRLSSSCDNEYHNINL